MECGRDTGSGPCVRVARHRGECVALVDGRRVRDLRRIRAAHDGYLRASDKMGAMVSAARKEANDIMGAARRGEGVGLADNDKWLRLQGFLEAMSVFDQLVLDATAEILEAEHLEDDEVRPSRWGLVSSVEQVTHPGEVAP